MLIPVQCFTCGNLLGDKWVDFKEKTEVVKICIRLDNIKNLTEANKENLFDQDILSILNDPTQNEWLKSENQEKIKKSLQQVLINLASSNEKEGVNIIDKINQQIMEDGCLDKNGKTGELY